MPHAGQARGGPAPNWQAGQSNLAGVDGVLFGHSAVLESATIGVPDERCGERVKSFVVLKPGQSATAEELEKYCRTNLAAYKVPREYEFLAELPKSSVLKVLRRELRDREIAKQRG